MPQAPDELRAKFEDDSDAWSKIKTNFHHKSGVIYPRAPGYKPTEHEAEAIDYLILEWDYDYNP